MSHVTIVGNVTSDATAVKRFSATGGPIRTVNGNRRHGRYAKEAS